MNLKLKKIKPKNMDYKFLAVLGIIVIFGLFILSSASYIDGQKKFGDSSYYLKEQLLKGVLLGFIGFFFFSRVPLEFLKKYSVFFLVFSIGLLVLVFFPKFGLTHSGSTRWLSFGFFNFQPSELLKLTFLIYLASWLESRQKELQNFGNGLLPFLIVIGVIGFLLLMQPNMGTFSVIFASAGIVYFVAGGKISHLVLMFLIGVLAFFTFIFLKPYGAERFKVFLNPQSDITNTGYQVNQALSSIGVGGLTGIGIKQNLISSYLPETIGDSIFAVLAEKLGLFGVSFIMVFYFLLALFGYRIAFKSRDFFSQLLVIGIISWILVQGFINVAAISGLIPLTGVPLPFISYGSSGLVVGLMGAGIVANVSRYIT